MIVVPHYEELSVRNSFNEVIRMYVGLEDYFPVYSNTYVPGRRHFWEVFATLYYDDAKRFIEDERTRRYETEEKENNKSMKIDPLIFKQIMDCKYFSKKKGRALYVRKEPEGDDVMQYNEAPKAPQRVKTARGTNAPASRRDKGEAVRRSTQNLTAGQVIDMQDDRRYNDSGQKFQTPSNKAMSPFAKRNNADMKSADR